VKKYPLSLSLVPRARLLGLRGRARVCMVIMLDAFGMRGAVAHPGRRVPGDLFCFASGHASPTLGCEI
jgi:hypothetical protein